MAGSHTNTSDNQHEEQALPLELLKDLEDRLYKWYRRMKASDFPVSSILFQSKASFLCEKRGFKLDNTVKSWMTSTLHKFNSNTYLPGSVEGIEYILPDDFELHKVSHTQDSSDDDNSTESSDDTVICVPTVVGLGNGIKDRDSNSDLNETVHGKSGNSINQTPYMTDKLQQKQKVIKQSNFVEEIVPGDASLFPKASVTSAQTNSAKEKNVRFFCDDSWLGNFQSLTGKVEELSLHSQKSSKEEEQYFSMSSRENKQNKANGSESSSSTTSSSSSSTESSSGSESESEATAEQVKKAVQQPPPPSTPAISDATCKHCQKVGPKRTFFGREKVYCAVTCYRAHCKTSQPTRASPSPNKTGKKGSTPKDESYVRSVDLSPVTPKKMKTVRHTEDHSDGFRKKKKSNGSFDWRMYLDRPGFLAAPVSCFKHVALADCWNNIIPGMKVEVENTDCTNYSNMLPTFYWIASVMNTAGYMALLRYEGFSTDDSKDFWVNLCTDDVHAVGWCASKGKPLIPPKSIENKFTDWKQFLVKRLTSARTLPADFAFKVEESMNNNIQKGMKLEVVDKNRISAVRVATVSQVIGGRLHVTYDGCETEDEGFWCHERSPLIHPVGWAQVIGHDLKATHEYARQSLHKTLFREFEPDDATWDMFLPVLNPVTDLKFKVGMKLEAIDPLNLSTICVATVTRVLRNNYLMIGIDGMMAANGSDWFCYHASSPCIFPVGFCETNGIVLTPPRGYKGEFKWDEYLKQTKSTAAPVGLFKKDIPDHGFEEGMHLEAVDLMEPRLICVGSVTKVVGRLLRIHFDGWEDAYDQWCDCESPDLFPLGWCQVVGYRLEPPRSEATEDTSKKKKRNFIYKGGQRRKKKSTVPSRPNRRSLFRSSTPHSISHRNKHKETNNDDRMKSSDGSSGTVAQDAGREQNGSPIGGKSPGPVLRLARSETDPAKWNVADVAQFLRMNECGAYSQIFSQEKIDGAKFLNMSKDGLISLMGMKVGPSLKIFHLIQQLNVKRQKT